MGRFERKIEALFGLNRHNFRHYTEKLADHISQSLHTKVYLKSKVFVGYGASIDAIDEDKSITLGTKICSTLTQSVVQFSIAAFHELRHVDNAQNCYKDVTGDKQIDSVLLFNYLAKHNNPDYYVKNNNYTKNVIEIDAEHYGVMSAYEYMCSKFSNVDEYYIEYALVNYINDRLQQRNGFEGVPYQIKDKSVLLGSIKDVDEAFDKAMKDAISGVSDDYKKIYMIGRSNDETAKLIAFDRQDDKWHDVRNAVIEARNADKDKLVGSLVLFKHKEYLANFDKLDIGQIRFVRTDGGKYEMVTRNSRASEVNQILPDFDNDCTSQKMLLEFEIAISLFG